jgi:hypothetical protein
MKKAGRGIDPVRLYHLGLNDLDYFVVSRTLSLAPPTAF